MPSALASWIRYREPCSSGEQTGTEVLQTEGDSGCHSEQPSHVWQWSLCGLLLNLSSVAQLCLTLCNPMDCSIPGLPVHHQLTEFTQTRVHWVGDAIQPNHLLLFPSPPTFNISQLQDLFKWISSSHQVAKGLEFQLQQSVLTMNIQDWFPLGCTGSPCSPRDSQESSPTPHFKSINSLALSFLYGPTLTSVHDYWKNHSLD